MADDATPTSNVWPSPEKMVIVVDTSVPVTVALKVTLGPLVTCATTVTGPGVNPSVIVVLAWPRASVTVEVVVIEDTLPEVTVKVTGTPLRSVTPAGGTIVITKGASVAPGAACK